MFQVILAFHNLDFPNFVVGFVNQNGVFLWILILCDLFIAYDILCSFPMRPEFQGVTRKPVNSKVKSCLIFVFSSSNKPSCILGRGGGLSFTIG